MRVRGGGLGNTVPALVHILWMFIFYGCHNSTEESVEMAAKRVLFVTPSPRKRARLTPRGRIARVRVLTRRIARRRRGMPMRRTVTRRKLPSARTRTGLTSLKGPDAKNSVRVEVSGNIGTRVWGAVDMCAIPESLTAVAHNARCGLEAHISGFSHRADFRNNTADCLRVYQYWIVPLFYKEDGLTDAELQADFFTRHGLTAETDASWSTTASSILYDEPVNGAKFAILKKSCFNLGSANLQANTLNTGSASAYKFQRLWIPLNRKYTYGHALDGEDTTRTIQPPVYYVSWCTKLFEADGTASVGSVLSRQIHSMVYFRDGESGM